MAALPPTPSTLRSWDEAFSHPLPVVRKLESELRTNISSNQEKLRSLVGASYRDLLGTAERIIDMDVQIQLVESNLTSIGRRCDYRVVECGRENLAGLRKVAGRRVEEGKLEGMARVKVLKGALEAVGRVVRKGGDALVGAKLLVLGRLLMKSVSEGGGMVEVVEELRKKMGILRKKLLVYVERSLVRTSGDRVSLANTLCAYAMITSSAPKDVLRHFLRVRYEQLETKAEEPSEARVLEMLEVYGKTLLDTRELFPRRCAEALSQLAKAPLLQDPQVANMQELNLDIYQRWIPEDIRTFTPWVRHDQLTSSEAAEGLKAWVRQAQTTLLQGIETCLQTQDQVKDVLSTRRTVLMKYLSVSSKIRNDQFSDAIDRIRTAFMTRLEELAVQSSDLSQIALVDSSISKPPSEGTKQASVWDLASKPIYQRAGALAFRSAILDHRHGRQGVVKQEHIALDNWLNQLNTFWDVVTSMRSLKWDDDLDFDLDDLDYEGDEALQDILSKNDPAQIELKLGQVTAEAFQATYARIEEAAEKEVNSATLIRLLREVDQRRLSLGDRVAGKPIANTLLISTLHASIAEQACAKPLEQLSASPGRRAFISTTIWDGTPPLPIQPSPSTFRFLWSLQRSMAAMGEDLGSPTAVNALKTHVSKSLSSSDVATILSPSTTERNPNAEASKAAIEAAEDATLPTAGIPSARNTEACIQRLFDTLYLSHVLSTPQDGSPLESVAAKLREGGDIDEAARQRLAKSAREYWKRTYLLFGLFAQRGV